MRDLLPDVGLLPDGFVAGVIGHEFYLHIEPDDGGAKAPPWWVIGIVARVLPSLRRKMRRAEELFGKGYFEELPRRWNAELADEQRAELRRRAAVNLATLSDEELFAHVRELRTFGVAREHRLPAVVGTHCATADLKDGEEVIVDGTQGTVTRVS